jgi:hypothetical protein
MEMPSEIRTKVISRLFERAEEAGWTHLSDKRRNEYYNQWVHDSEIGGRLREFASPEEVRVWIKDGPMKEFSRARYGAGAYAGHISNPSTAPQKLVERALGPGWEPDMATQQVKPLRLIARRGDEATHFAWGPARDLKHLVWAAIKAQADGNDGTPWCLCVVGSFERPTPTDEKKFHIRIGERCGLRVVHVDD